MGISLLRLSAHKDFYLWLKESRKESTSRLHVALIDRILRNVHTLTYDNVTDYFYRLQLDGVTGVHINHQRDSIRVYTQYLIEKNLPHDPRIFEIKKAKEVQTEKATLSDQEIEAFLNLPGVVMQRHRTGVMMKRKIGKIYDLYTLFFSILAYSGMRPTEVSHLRTDDIDFGRNVFILRDTKTNDSRYVPIAQNLIPLLEQRIKEVPENTYLFPSSRGGNNNGVGQVFDSVDWHHNFNTRIKRLQIKRRNLSVYSLRHSFITRLLDEDINIFKVQKIVGHKRIETTSRYTHLTTKDINLAIQKDPLFTRSNPQGKLNYIKDILTGLLLDNTAQLELNISDTPTSIKFEASIKDERT